MGTAGVVLVELSVVEQRVYAVMAVAVGSLATLSTAVNSILHGSSLGYSSTLSAWAYGAITHFSWDSSVARAISE